MFFMNRYRSESTRGLSLKESSLMLAGFGVLFVGGSFGCAKVVETGFDESDARRVVEENGFVDPEVTEVNRILPGLQGCGEGDAIGFEIEALAPNGNIAQLIVCKGIFKGATVRQD